MKKIATSHEFQAEVLKILASCQGTERPSRERLASELRGLADRLSAMPGNAWTHKGDQWLARSQYADGDRYEWVIKEEDDKFSLTVKTPEGSLKRKQEFNSLEQAQKYAWRFIDRADGKALFEKALKDFKK